MDTQKNLDGLKTAMQTEINGIEFYTMAAERTSDEKGKEVFKLLAQDEKEHLKELQKHFQSLKSSNTWAPSISLNEAKVMYKGDSPIFSKELKARIKERHFEMSALSIGALLESEAIDYYRKMKEDSDDDVARELYEKLQKWEQKHLEAITTQINVLKENYWAEQHFSPLF